LDRTSAAVNLYVRSVAPGIVAQLLSFESQRRHMNANAIGVVPVHVPVVVVTVSPSRAVPERTGRTVFTGGDGGGDGGGGGPPNPVPSPAAGLEGPSAPVAGTARIAPTTIPHVSRSRARRRMFRMADWLFIPCRSSRTCGRSLRKTPEVMPDRSRRLKREADPRHRARSKKQRLRSGKATL
jgi:hypothetical protein